MDRLFLMWPHSIIGNISSKNFPLNCVTGHKHFLKSKLMEAMLFKMLYSCFVEKVSFGLIILICLYLANENK